MNKDPPNNSNINSNQTLATVLFDLIKAAAMTTATPISALISAAASNQTAMTATTNTTTLTTTTSLNSSSNKSIYNETYLNSSISSSSSLIGLLSSSLSSAREQIVDSSLMSTATSSAASSTASASAQPQLNIDVPLSTIYISMIAYAFIFAIGFFGNALVILVAYCSRRAQQNSTHYCLVNLSVADLLLIIVCMPSAVLDLFSKEVWYLGYFLCKIIPWLEHTVAQASILTIVSISIERSLAIASPLRAKRFFTSELLWLVVVLIWTISTISSIPIMVSTKYIQGLFHKKLATNVTVCVVDAGKKWTLVYLYISLFLFYLLPCFSLFALYGNIVLIIKRRSKKAGNGNGGSGGGGGGGTYNGTSATAAAALLAAHRHSKYSMTNHTNKNGGNGGGKQQQIYMEDLEDDEEIEKTGSLAVPASRNSSGKSFGKHWSSRRNDEHRRVANQAASILLPQINQKQIILLLIVMMMTIFICLLPYRVFSLWMAQASKQQLEKLGLVKYYNIITFCRLAFYTNSALNPIFYHIISTKFRAAFKRYFRFSFNVSLNSVAQRANGGNGGQAGGGGGGGQAAAHERPAITPVAVATAGQSRKYIHQPCRSMTKDESAIINATKI